MMRYNLYGAEWGPVFATGIFLTLQLNCLLINFGTLVNHSDLMARKLHFIYFMVIVYQVILS